MIYNLEFVKPYEHLLRTWKDILSAAGPVDGAEFFIRKAEAHDALLLDIRDEQKDTFDRPSLDWAIKAHAWLSMLSPMNYTIFHGEKMLMCITVMAVSQGVAEISFLTDVNFVDAPRQVKLPLLRAFHKALAELPFKRIQAKVKADFTIGRTFVERMGMSEEGVMRKYGPKDDDYILYALIKE